MDIFKAAKIENADKPIKSQDITNPYSKTCQLILFLYTLHFSEWTEDWKGDYLNEEKKADP